LAVAITTVADPDASNHILATGTATPGATVTVIWPDASTSTVVADATTGKWSIESTKVQTTGDVQAIAHDNQGNVSAPAVLNYHDTTPPLAPTFVVADPNNDGKPTASGTAEPNSTVTVTWPDTSTSTVQVGSNGLWSVEATAKQTTAGNVTAYATDAAGNPGPTATKPWTLGPQPVLTITVDDQDNNGQPNATGTAPPNSTLTITWPDNHTTSTVTTNALGVWSVEAPTTQPSGNVTVHLVGGTTPDVVFKWTDSIPPNPPTLTVTDPGNTGTPTASGTAEPGSTVIVHWPDTTSIAVVAGADGTWTVNGPAGEKGGTVTATATDQSNNISQSSNAQWTPGAGGTVPTTPTANIADTGSGTITVSGTADPGDKITVTLPNGASPLTTTADATGHYTVSGPAPNGNGTINVTATDPTSGNTSSAGQAQYTDITPPPKPTETVVNNNDGTITISGTTEPGNTITVTLPGTGNSVTATADGNGNYSITTPAPTQPGNITATATDPAGNHSVASDPSPWTPPVKSACNATGNTSRPP
jgi:hypothetical protein